MGRIERPAAWLEGRIEDAGLFRSPHARRPEGHDQWLAGLGPVETDLSGAPEDRVQLQGGDFAGPQAVGRHEQEHGIVAPSNRGGAVDLR